LTSTHFQKTARNEAAQLLPILAAAAPPPPLSVVWLLLPLFWLLLTLIGEAVVSVAAFFQFPGCSMNGLSSLNAVVTCCNVVRSTLQTVLGLLFFRVDLLLFVVFVDEHGAATVAVAIAIAVFLLVAIAVLDRVGALTAHHLRVLLVILIAIAGFSIVIVVFLVVLFSIAIAGFSIAIAGFSIAVDRRVLATAVDRRVAAARIATTLDHVQFVIYAFAKACAESVDGL